MMPSNFNSKVRSLIVLNFLFRLILLIVVIVVLGKVFQYFEPYIKTEVKSYNYKKWKECIEMSNGTDDDCAVCDSIYNKDKLFKHKK